MEVANTEHTDVAAAAMIYEWVLIEEHNSYILTQVERCGDGEKGDKSQQHQMHDL